MLEEGNVDEEITKAQDEYYQLRTNSHQNLGQLRSLCTTNQTSTTEKTVVVRPKLPSIQLPTFLGELTEFEAFLDQFEAQIGSRQDLEPVTKLQYLKSQLKGQALELIQGYSSTSANYKSVLDTLKETYGDEEKIKHSLLQKIVNIDPPKHNKGDLETFRIAMLNLTRVLKNKHDFTCCEWIISSMFQHKLVIATIRQLYFKYEVNYFTLSQLNDGLRDIVSHMDTEARIKSNKRSKQEVPDMSADQSKDTNVGTYYSTG